MTDENIIEFKTVQPSMDIKEKSYEQKYRCGHRQLVLHDDRKLVECEECSVFFDSYDFLLKYARGEVRLRSSIAHLTSEKKILIEQVEDLKRQKRNLKSSINRLKR